MCIFCLINRLKGDNLPCEQHLAPNLIPSHGWANPNYDLVRAIHTWNGTYFNPKATGITWAEAEKIARIILDQIKSAAARNEIYVIKESDLHNYLMGVRSPSQNHRRQTHIPSTSNGPENESPDLGRFRDYLNGLDQQEGI